MIAIPAGTLHHKASRDGAVERIAMPSFVIARHLATVADYTAFIDDGGYDDASHWSSDGWRWRLEADVDMPRFWDDEQWAPYLVASHPVVGVSAYEAEAYAAFRGARLPSEREWERACRGDDARDYPWGDSWHEGRCAHRESGPRCTRPVGSFPDGVSPFGLYDLVGSVWQWTSDGTVERVVCGGAWNNKPWSIGSAGRNAFRPAAQFSNLGFRLAADARD